MTIQETGDAGDDERALLGDRLDVLPGDLDALVAPFDENFPLQTFELLEDLSQRGR